LNRIVYRESAEERERGRMSGISIKVEKETKKVNEIERKAAGLVLRRHINSNRSEKVKRERTDSIAL
jgi:hypothetical protein